MGRRTDRRINPRFFKFLFYTILYSISFTLVVCDGTGGGISQFLNKPVIVVRINNELKQTESSVGLGDFNIGATRDIPLVIKNSGTIALSFTDVGPITFTGSDASRFSIKEEIPASLDINENVPLTLVCHAGAVAGTFEAVMNISYNDTEKSPYTMSLSGTVLPSTSSDTTAPTPGGSGVITLVSKTNTSVSISWAAGTDDITAAIDLQYKVVRSESANIDTADKADTYGTAVLNWQADAESVAASGLTEGTTYYFNVIIRDAAENKAAYTMISVKTLESLNLTVSLQQPGEEDIPFDTAQDLQFTSSQSFTVTVTNIDFTNFSWKLDGDDFGGSTNSVNVDCEADITELGIHTLTVFAEKNGELYSKTLWFKLVN